jgi:TolB-like protein
MSLRALSLLLLILTASTAAAEEPISIAVMEFTSKGGVTQDQMDALSDMLSNQIRSMGNYKVIGKSDIHSMLTMEEQRQRLSSCTDQSCLAEIGGALGARWVVVGNVSLFGKTYLLNLKLIDVAGASVASGVSRSIEGGEDKLLAELPGAAKEMFDAVAGQLTKEKKPPDEKKEIVEKKEEVKKEEKKEESPKPARTGWFTGPAERKGKWSLWGLGSFVYLISGGSSGEEAFYTGRMEESAMGGQLGAGIGYSFLEWLTLEIQLGGHYLAADNRSNWAVDLTVGLRATWPIDSIIQPMAVLGVGGGVVRDKPNEVAGDEYNIWGAGPLVYIGLGADLYFTPNWFGGLRLKGTFWIYDIVEKDTHDIAVWTQLFGVSVVGVTGWQF